MTQLEKYGAIILSINRGLWGEVTPSLRLVQVSFDNESIRIYFYFARQPSDEEVESTRIVGTSVAADFPSYQVAEQLAVAASSASVPKIDGRHTVFMAKDA